MTAIWPCVNPANTNIIEAFERVIKSSDNHLAMCEPCQYQHYWSFWKSGQVEWQLFGHVWTPSIPTLLKLLKEWSSRVTAIWPCLNPANTTSTLLIQICPFYTQNKIKFKADHVKTANYAFRENIFDILINGTFAFGPHPFH